jgi:hypothetical protein
MKLNYVRIQARYSGKTGKPVGIFGACWHLLRGVMRTNRLTEDEAKLFMEIEAWFRENLPEPPFYSDGNSQKVITWFKTDTTKEMLERLRPLMDLLDKYNVPFDIVYTNSVGTTVYEDKYQVAVE